MSILVLQHADCEPPGTFSRVFAERNVGVRTVRPDLDEPTPDLAGVVGIIAMGGPMGVLDAGSLPWIRRELEVISHAVHSGVPYLGVCLGAQLLAAALGARVYRGAVPEVGVEGVALTDAGVADPLMSVFPRRFRALHWHSDSFDLPRASIHLATSRAYVNQAFRWSTAYGIQFHVEASSELCSQWVTLDSYRASARAVLGNEAEDRITAAVQAVDAELERHALTLIGRWLDVFAHS